MGCVEAEPLALRFVPREREHRRTADGSAFAPPSLTNPRRCAAAVAEMSTRHTRLITWIPIGGEPALRTPLRNPAAASQ